MKKLIAGNWKMNGNRDAARALIAGIINGFSVEDGVLERADILVCPPSLYIRDVHHALAGFPKIVLGAQDCSAHENGAYTGELSAEMLKDAGCSYVILGHSERRQHHGESDSLIAQKTQKALEAGITPIICVGETQSQREEGAAERVVEAQITGSIPDLGAAHEIVVAYEPVWAIGTGKTATPQDVTIMHGFIRDSLKALVDESYKVRILYGGSMKPENASELLACENVDGGLIGGASLNAEQFLSISRAA